jgi:aerobic-type carbon monoxide dehydrogenase small subunit (CoxS/CutS family)
MDLVINGARKSIAAEPDRPLLWVLRNDLDYTGAKYGCGEGQCGACTVLIDGVAERSCITPVGSAAGKEITTIEGLADGEKLHAVQEAFIACDAMQCGYCTSGMILSTVALLRKNPTATEAQIREALEGNICRCGAYNRILAAVEKARQMTLSEARETHRG